MDYSFLWSYYGISKIIYFAKSRDMVSPIERRQNKSYIWVKKIWYHKHIRHHRVLSYFKNETRGANAKIWIWSTKGFPHSNSNFGHLMTKNSLWKMSRKSGTKARISCLMFVFQIICLWTKSLLITCKCVIYIWFYTMDTYNFNNSNEPGIANTNSLCLNVIGLCFAICNQKTNHVSLVIIGVGLLFGAMGSYSPAPNSATVFQCQHITAEIKMAANFLTTFYKCIFLNDNICILFHISL